MPSQIGKLKYLFVLLMGLASIAIVSYGWLYSIPKKKCEGAGGWYSWKAHKCYTPVRIENITGRKAAEPAKTDASNAAVSQ